MSIPYGLRTYGILGRLRISGTGVRMKIWKYRLPLKVVNTVTLPQGAEILQFQAQGKDVVFWAIVDENAPVKERTFHLVGTGWELPKTDYEDGIVYLGTVQLGGFVWHVFEEV